MLTGSQKHSDCSQSYYLRDERREAQSWVLGKVSQFIAGLGQELGGTVRSPDSHSARQRKGDCLAESAAEVPSNLVRVTKQTEKRTNQRGDLSRMLPLCHDPGLGD